MRLTDGKFELTNQDSAGLKSSTVLTLYKAPSTLRRRNLSSKIEEDSARGVG